MRKSQGHVAGARRAQRFVGTLLRVDPVKAAHHKAVQHIDHRLGHRIVDPLQRQHALLHNQRLRPRCGQQRCLRGQVFAVAQRHQTHTAVPVVVFDHHKGPLLDAVFLVFAPGFQQHGLHLGAQRIQPLGRGQIERAADFKVRVDQPGVHADQLGKALGRVVVAVEVPALAAHRPARVQRRQQVLRLQVFQNAGDAAGQVGVEQNRAGVEVLHANAPALALHRLKHHALTAGHRQGQGFFQVRADRAKAHIQAGHLKDAPQLHQVAQVKAVAHMVVGHDQQVARLGAGFFHGGERRLHRQRQHGRGQVVPAAGEKIGIHRRQLEAGVAHID